MATFPRTWAEIDLGAFRRNLQAIRKRLSPPVRFCLVVKANAYGHGLIPICRTAANSGADWLAVATAQEGIAVREAEIQKPVLVLAPILPLEAPQTVHYDLRTTVDTLEIAEAISEAAQKQGKIAKVHLKVDTGMARFGVLPHLAPDMALRVSKLPNVEIEGVSTHFANAGGDHEFTTKQFESFRHALAQMESLGVAPPIRHCANSSASMLRPEMQMDMARIGVFSYGIKHIDFPELDVEPILRWKTRIMAMRTLPAGSTVGYNCTCRLDRESRIATVGVGYGDGYPRALSNVGCVLIHGRRAPITGLVAMDQMMVDVTDIPEAKIGDDVGLVLGEVTARELATLVGTTPHEIPTRIMARVPRSYSSG
ncbi:MAG: Alanine racemase 1 [Fimbriimonadales bacterium]|nr:MAG: alanine racemase [Armatimonadota bacterium]MBV6502159.1 Alanine racemase 1 [Fimbriimonadales bacterium]MCE7898994.1 alanine racemase [Armatimonadetes bacterium ATM1]MDL1927449.1 alanine racemase [Fimbriimonadia bacterium ATM]MBC6969726.1 alanine racemase [Armatimonadota bacterium]